MDTKALDKIKDMRSVSASLVNFHTRYIEKYAADSNCDKKGYGFGEDSRFASFNISTHFASWSGYYGSSSCSTILSVQNTILVEKYLVKAMNVHQRELFATAARILQEDAEKLTGDAEKEIAALTEMLQQARLVGAEHNQTDVRASTVNPPLPKK